jgi:ATP-dependent RNA helicase DDX27
MEFDFGDVGDFFDEADVDCHTPVEIRTDVHDTIEEASNWQLSYGHIPRNPDTISSTLASKIETQGDDITSFKFVDDPSDVRDTDNKQSSEKENPLYTGDVISWGELGISRPVLKAISQVLKFPQPSHIQSVTIPAAIAGKDILASASTGSGKTAAFLIPMIERILVSPGVSSRRKDRVTGRITGGRAAIRGIILMPTRELAIQCWSMLKALATFIPVTSALVTGGFDSREQLSDLSKSPDILIATPGRLLDHILNSQGVHLDNVDMVVLDEADRLLEMGFQESITEILKALPKKSIAMNSKSRSNGQCQTMLFSATISSGVSDLASYVLSSAVTTRISDPSKVVSTLVQEFVKIGKEELREASFLALLETSVQTAELSSRVRGRVVVFFGQKQEAHRMATIAQIFGLSVAELNGNMTQIERLSAMADFQSGQKKYLFATDIASRGLDLPNIALVINYNLPPGIDSDVRYIHRVGRSARGGRDGRSITLYTAEEYPAVKRIIKKSLHKDQRDKIFERRIAKSICEIWHKRVHAVQSTVRVVNEQEKLEHDIFKASKKLSQSGKDRSGNKQQQKPTKSWIKTTEGSSGKSAHTNHKVSDIQKRHTNRTPGGEKRRSVKDENIHARKDKRERPSTARNDRRASSSDKRGKGSPKNRAISRSEPARGNSSHEKRPRSGDRKSARVQDRHSKPAFMKSRK